MNTQTNETTSAANAAVQQITESDIVAFMQLRANEILARYPQCASASVEVRRSTCTDSGRYNFTVHLVGSGFRECGFGSTIEQAEAKAAASIDTPAKILAKRREELAKIQADIAALENPKPVAEAA